MLIWEREKKKGVGQKESGAWEKGRFEETRAVRNGLMQMSH